MLSTLKTDVQAECTGGKDNFSIRDPKDVRRRGRGCWGCPGGRSKVRNPRGVATVGETGWTHCLTRAGLSCRGQSLLTAVWPPGQDPAAWASPCALSTGGRWAVCPCVLLLTEAVKAATGSHLRRQGPVSDHWLYWPRLRGCGEGRAASGGSQSHWAPGL